MGTFPKCVQLNQLGVFLGYSIIIIEVKSALPGFRVSPIRQFSPLVDGPTLSVSK